ncbi:hypothetical protein D5F11_024805 [Siminovitchia terrae]|uniref:Uncharacterized protein n=1 Tax=Siminovitchia terrae TaxID=1914933 RepID=A0A429X0X0_SIMTE|nr:hypothetical protein [Siminovitchia terrae]RST57067.1 hypothetical protein D5F11_024805 [Siminovitchia terrae]
MIRQHCHFKLRAVPLNAAITPVSSLVSPDALKIYETTMDNMYRKVEGPVHRRTDWRAFDEIKETR